MSPRTSGLTVRQHERRAVQFEVLFVITSEHCRQVRFSATAAAVSPTSIRGRMVDLSSGGMGLLFHEFLPRMTEGVVRVFGRRRVDSLSDGTPVFDVIFEHRVKVRRVTMSSHEPTYELGVSFIEPGPELPVEVDALLEAMGNEGLTADPRGPEARVNDDA